MDDQPSRLGDHGRYPAPLFLLTFMTIVYRMQFSIRYLLLAVASLAVAIAGLKWLAQFAPAVIDVALVAWFVLGMLCMMLGLGVVAFGGLVAFSVYMSNEDENRTENLKKCRSLVGIGLAMGLPFLSLYAVVPFFRWL